MTVQHNFKYFCSYCGEELSNSTNKFKHMTLVHGDQYEKDLINDGWKRQKEKFGKKKP